MSFEFKPIATISTCFHDKFGIPRQPGLVRSAPGVLHFVRNPHYEAALRGLEEFSHLWLVFVFHKHDAKDWRPTVRPPRLGGAQKIGVLASRSPHRPNPIGLSVVELVRVEMCAKEILVHVRGVDLLDQTPILDIKPYIPYADSVPRAQSGWAKEKIKRMPVRISKIAMAQFREIEKTRPGITKLAKEILALDPRPAFQKRKEGFKGNYGFTLYEWDIKWRPEGKYFLIERVEQV